MTQQGRHTNLGCGIYDWDPYRKLSITARYVWLYIYSGPESRNALPGLLRMSIRSLAEAASVSADDCLHAMDEMVEAGLVEVDVERRVIRLTQFPDRHERAYNGNVVRGWWTRFQAFPDCPMRNAHVETLRWLMEAGAAASVVEAWSETFERVQIPAKRRRGRQRFDSDTSTAAQPSLFSASGPPVAESASICVVPYLPNVESTTYDTVSKPTGIGTGTLRSSSSQEDPRAQFVPDGLDVMAQAYVLPPLPVRPPLGLVPLPDDLPFTPADLVAELAAESDGRFMATAIDQRLLESLCATIRSCAANGIGLADVRVVGRWLAAGGLAYRHDLDPVWAARPGNLLGAIGWAGKWHKDGGGPVGAAPKRAEPTPASAFGPSGRRAL